MPNYKINKITFNNFKFFYQTVSINFDRKHVLAYGENGSGKSSLYWALYTFMQSVFKENPEIRKYFDPRHPENLINRFSTEPSNSGIHLELKDEAGNVIVKEISINEINTKADSIVRELTLGSDFINHHTLSRIYAYYHKEEIDLFKVFEHELLAFITFGTPLVKVGEEVTNDNAEVWWRYIESGIPNLEEKAQIERYLKGFNDNFINYLNTITEATNKYITDTFKEKLNIKFEYRPASYPLPVNDTDPVEKGQAVKAPEIIMTVVMLTDKIADDNKKEIDSPQSFLNEAKLSTIALALRLAILDEKYVEAFPKVLVLDDMLMSMDMSNREFVLSVILNNYQADYQIIFLTHQRGLFEDARKFIQGYYGEKLKAAGETNPEILGSAWTNSWGSYEMYEGENSVGVPIPKILAHGDNLQKAIYYFKEQIDYNACGNNLRAALEDFFITFVPNKFREHGNMIAGLLVSARNYFNHVGFDTAILDMLERYRERSLNPSSHYNPRTDFFKRELQEVFTILESLKRNRNDAILIKDEKVKFSIRNKAGVSHSYTALLLDDIRLYKRNDDSPSFFVDSDKRGYMMIEYKEGEKNVVQLDVPIRGLTLTELYYDTAKGLAKKSKPILRNNVYRVFTNEQNVPLLNLKIY